MKDVFSILGIDTKEDYYTFALHELLEDSRDFRKKSAEIWGFEREEEDYKVIRNSIKFETRTRNKITPDLILFNENHISVIESKMYSGEGEYQTKDYAQSKERIKEHLEKEHKIKFKKDVGVSFYFFTLLGIEADSDEFNSVKWAEYYENTLENITFSNEYLNMIAKAIFERAKEYNSFTKNVQKQKYVDIVNNPNSWISIYSLLADNKSDIWRILMVNMYEKINTSSINGNGHGEIITYFTPKEYYKEDENKYCVQLFSKIIWNKDSIDICMNFEYAEWEEEYGKRYLKYIPNSRLDEKKKGLSEKNEVNRKACSGFLKEELRKRKIKYEIKVDGRWNWLQMMKTTLDVKDRRIEDIVVEATNILMIYGELISAVYEKLEIKEGFLVFV